MQLELFGCNEIRVDDCESACCYYPDKEITIDEAADLQYVVKKEGTWYLKNKEFSGACFYLDEDSGSCEIYNSRPDVCKVYSCERDPSIRGLITLVKTQDLSLRKQVVNDLRQTAASSNDPDSFMELMGL
jgi:hypothetical protein